MSNASNAVASLEDTLTLIKTAVAKQGNNMQGDTSLTANTPAADDGDQSQPTGDLQREQIAAVKDQQSLSHESTDGVADSPAFNNAADSTGSVGETKADADAVKNDADDDQHASPSKHPARTDNSKIANLLKIAEDIEEGEYEEMGEGEGEEDEEHMEKMKSMHGKKEAMDEGSPQEGEEGYEEHMAAQEAEGAPMEGEGAPMEGEGTVEPSEEELAQIEALLGGADPKMAAAIPTLPTDQDELVKVASDGALDTYMEKVASVFPADVQEGYAFAENLAQSLHASAVKTAGEGTDEDEIAEIQKLAMDDAGNVAEILAGMGEGAPQEAPAGVEDPMAGAAPVEGEEVPMPAGVGGEGGEGAGEAEALLQALQAAGISPESLMKAASEGGFDSARAKTVLAKAVTV